MLQKYQLVDSEFSKRVRELRYKLGWKQQRLASEAGVSLKTIKRIENIKGQEKRRFLPSNLHCIAHALGVSLSRLFNGQSLETVEDASASEQPITLTQMLEAFLKTQQDAESGRNRLMAELERFGAQQIAIEQQSRELIRKRIVGPLSSAVAHRFKDRLTEMRILHEKLTDEKLRLLLVCGRAGIGKWNRREDGKGLCRFNGWRRWNKRLNTSLPQKRGRS